MKAGLDEHAELPYGSFEQFKKACVQKRCYVAVNSVVLDQWFSGRWDGFGIFRALRANSALVAAAAVALCGGMWARWLLCVFPLSILLLVALSPRSPRPNSMLRVVVVLTLVSSFFWALTTGDTERGVISGGLILVWIIDRLTFSKRNQTFFARLLSDEQFCLTAWNRGAFAVRNLDDAPFEAPIENLNDELSYTPPAVEVTAVFGDKDVQINIQSTNSQTTPRSGEEDGESNSEAVRRVELRAMKIVLQYEREQGRKPEDVSMYFVGYDIKSRGEAGSRAIEVKGKVSPGGVILTANEWKTAHRLNDNYFLYIVENVFSASPTIKIIQNPYGKIQPSVKGVQYQLKRRVYKSKSNEIELATRTS